MMAFAACALLMIGFAVWMLRPAARVTLTPARSATVAIIDDQLAALDREHAAGLLDADQHRAARSEQQRRLLDETATAEAAIQASGSRAIRWSVGLAIPLLAIALYAAIGNPAGVTVEPTAPAPTATADEPEVSAEAVQAMLASLAQQLERPSGNAARDLQGWTMLARSYAALRRFADADRAYAHAIALAPDDAQLLADRADVLAMLQGQRSAGEPERLIAQALALDPHNLKALALAGSAAYERQDFAEARRQWQTARELAPDGSAFAAGLDRSLAEVSGAGGQAATGNPGTSAGTATNADPGTAAARIRGRVSLAPALAVRAAPTDTVFIFARAAEGPRMPLAILRRTVADLPFTFTLDDSLAMSAQLKLSSFDRVIVGARISRAGSAMPQSGDLRGESTAVATRTDDLQLVIDGVQP